MFRYILMGFVILLASCQLEEPFSLDFDQEAFQENQAKWESWELTEYRMVQQNSNGSYGPGPEITVVNNQGVITLSYEEGYDQEQAYPFYFESVDEIFSYIELIRQDYLDHSEQISSAEIEVLYHGEWGYPQYVHYSASYREDIVGGSYGTLRVLSLE